MKVRAPFLFGLTCWMLVLTRVIHAAEAPTGTWAKIYSSDIPTYAANLRAAGVPAETVGVLVSQEINARFKEREQALEPSLASLQTLKEGWSAERREALVKLKREKNDLLRATLGAVPNETAKIEVLYPSLASANPQQRDMVRLIIEDYQAMSARVNTESRGYLLEEDKEKLRYLEDELIVDLGKTLDAERALDFQIEQDGAMRAMQQRLELFKPTRLEIRDIYMARRNTGLDVELRGRNGNRVIELEKATLAELAKHWSPERHVQYCRLTSSIYQQTFHLVRRLNLPAEIADQLYDSRKATVEKGWDLSQQLRASGGTRISRGTVRPVSPSDFMKQAMAEHLELAKRLLGQAGYEDYFRSNSVWIEVALQGALISPDVFVRALLF